jgi:hypothetical protein
VDLLCFAKGTRSLSSNRRLKAAGPGRLRPGADTGIRSHGRSSSSNCTKSRRAAGTHPLGRLRAGPHSISLTPAGPATRAGNRRHFKSSNRAASDWPALTLVAGAGPHSLATNGLHLFRIATAGQHCLRVSPGHDRALRLLTPRGHGPALRLSPLRGRGTGTRAARTARTQSLYRCPVTPPGPSQHCQNHIDSDSVSLSEQPESRCRACQCPH